MKAVVVLKPGTQATEQEIIDTARRHLASYQKPRIVEFVDALPKAPTGKILKRALRDALRAPEEGFMSLQLAPSSRRRTTAARWSPDAAAAIRPMRSWTSSDRSAF